MNIKDDFLLIFLLGFAAGGLFFMWITIEVDKAVKKAFKRMNDDE